MKSARNISFYTLPVFALMVIGCYGGVIHHFRAVAQSDPDRYFHLALARITASQGLIYQLPQVEHLGWATHFQEKNFLFTYVTSLAYRYGGESSAIGIISLCALALGLLFFLTLHLKLPSWSAALLAVLPLASPDFANRISLFRPHVLAMLSFTLLLYGLLSRRKYLCFLGAGLYALSYHALYVPIGLLLTFFGLIAMVKIIKWDLEATPFTPPLFGFIGLVFGILVNPYFPQSLYSTRNSVRMALNLSRVSELERPIEIIPMDTHEFIAEFGFYLLLLAVAWWRLAFSTELLSQLKVKIQDRQNFLVLLLSATLYWGLALYSRRALEYGIPLGVLVLGYLLYLRGKYATGQILLLPLALLFYGPFATRYYTRPLLPAVDTSYVLNALNELPSESQSKIFNCEWDNGAFILYQRPQMRFLDLTDPILLADYAPRDYALRKQLKEGTIRDPHRLIREYFKAQYVLCDHLTVQNQLESDTRFHRIYPSSLVPLEERRPGFTTLYALNP